MKTFLFQTPISTYEIKAESLEVAKKAPELKGLTIEKIADADDAHVCKYCGCIAPGNYDDLLCDECRSIFGHAPYSEL